MNLSLLGDFSLSTPRSAPPLLFYILAGFAAVVAAFVAVFVVLFLVTCLWERQYLSGDVEPASEPFPYPPSPYWRVTCEAARALGLEHAGDFATRKGTSHVKGLMSLFFNRDRSVMVAISSSAAAGAKLKKTVFWTRLATGRVLESTDNPGIDDLSGVIERGVLLNADVPELAAFHQQRVQQSGSTPLPFNANAALQENERIYLERGARWVLLGLARWVDPQQTSIRMTFRGASAQLARVFQQIGKLSDQHKRSHIRRAGSRGS